jgi:hypothetical protein
MPPLSNAPPALIKPLQPVPQDTLEILVMLLVNCVLLVLIQILEPALAQHRVVTVPLESFH